MTFTITKEFAFSASHRLDGLPEGHQCARLHGHNYVVEVELQADDLDDTGFVLDFGELAPIKDFLDRHFDHQHLPDVAVLRGVQTSAEVMARFLFHQFADQYEQLSAVRISETPKTWATYRPTRPLTIKGY